MCIYTTHRVHSCKNHFLLLPTLTQPNPTRLFTFPFSSNFPFLFLSLFSSSFIIPPFPPLPLTFTSLPLPYPIPPSLKSLPTLPCPALSRLSGIITCTQKKKKTNPKRPKKKKTICLFNLSNLASITSLSQSHIFFRERGRGGGREGGRGTTVPTGTRPQRLWWWWWWMLTRWFKLPSLAWFFVWGRGRRGLLTCFACLLAYTTYCSTELSGTAL